jgi:hypothetical protein
MPAHAEVTAVETFMLNGEEVQRVTLTMNGHDVQVLAYGESPSLSVMVDDDLVEQVHLILLDEFLARVCGTVKP